MSYADREREQDNKLQTGLLILEEEEKRRRLRQDQISSSGGSCLLEIPLAILALLVIGPIGMLCVRAFNNRGFLKVEGFWFKMMKWLVIVGFLLGAIVTVNELGLTEKAMAGLLCIGVPVAFLARRILNGLPRFLIGLLFSAPWGAFLGALYGLLVEGTAGIATGATGGALLIGIPGALWAARELS